MPIVSADRVFESFAISHHLELKVGFRTIRLHSRVTPVTTICFATMTDTTDDIPHTDLIADGWIDRHMPAWTQPYLKLARLDRPTGILAAAVTVLVGKSQLASPTAATGIGHDGAVHHRRHRHARRGLHGETISSTAIIDAQVETYTRTAFAVPARSGCSGALVFLALELALGLVVLIQLNRLTIWLGVASLVLVGVYPLMKRLTWWAAGPSLG